MVLIIMTGRSAAGKSSVAVALAKMLDAVVISTDEARREILGKYGFAENEREKVTAAVYGELFRRAKKALAEGKNVILDGTFYSRTLRQAARELDVSSFLVFVNCSPEKRRERTFKKGLPADVYEEPEDADVTVDTEKQSADECAERVLAALKG